MKTYEQIERQAMAAFDLATEIRNAAGNAKTSGQWQGVRYEAGRLASLAKNLAHELRELEEEAAQ